MVLDGYLLGQAGSENSLPAMQNYEKYLIFAIMKKSMLYTRTGDTGLTSLMGGVRVPKNCIRVNAYGTVDELSAQLGLVRAHLESLPQACEQDVVLLADVMGKMFCIGAYLATPVASDGTSPAECKGLTDEDITVLEGGIDRLDAEVPPQRSFILPGGTVAAAHAHVARTVCRRAEREVLTLASSGEPVLDIVLRYLNRLSDYLYILARALNYRASTPDIPWP